MQLSAFAQSLWRLLPLLGCLAAAAPALATEPLHDQYTDGGRRGHIFPSACCWVDLPSNDKIREIRRKEIGCSAIGGPVGEFKREDGKLWLTGLMKCGGHVDLQTVFPDMPGPVVATWLSGTFRTRLDYLCYASDGKSVYAVGQELLVDKGVVVSEKEIRQDRSACAPKP